MFRVWHKRLRLLETSDTVLLYCSRDLHFSLSFNLGTVVHSSGCNLTMSTEYFYIVESFSCRKLWTPIFFPTCLWQKLDVAKHTYSINMYQSELWCRIRRLYFVTITINFHKHSWSLATHVSNLFLGKKKFETRFSRKTTACLFLLVF